jgi:hypothetical protein
MEKIDFFRIILDKDDHAVFFPNDILDGKIHIKVNKPLKINGVKILVNGDTSVYW